MFWKIQLYHSMHWESVTHRPLIKEWSINESMNILSKNMSTVILQPCSFGFLLASRISINNWGSLLSILQEQKENNEVEFTQGLLRHIPNHSYNLLKGLYLGSQNRKKNINTKYNIPTKSLVDTKYTWSPLCIVIGIDRYECVHSSDLESVGFLQPWIKVFRYYFYQK